MKFEDLDKRMRVFETGSDQCVLPGIHMVARIDGRCFTHLTKQVHRFDAPYDERFRDMMVETTKHLMTCGFQAIYGYTQSDEISLVLHRDDETFGRKLRKLHSVLAGEASARFSLLLGAVGSFDCRISQFPNVELVVDYLRWRQEDAYRNFINGHCYWALRRAGKEAGEANSTLVGLSIPAKKSLLFRVAGINYRHLPDWQKHGIGVTLEDYEKAGVNPLTGASCQVISKRLKVEENLPRGDAYGTMIRILLQKSL